MTAAPAGIASALQRDDDAALWWSVDAEQPMTRQRLTRTAERLAAHIGDRGQDRVWIATDDPEWAMVAWTASAGRCRPAMLPAATPAGACPAFAASSHPTLVLHAGPSGVVDWAQGAGVATLDVAAPQPVGRTDVLPGGVSLWTSGTTRGPRLVDITAGHIDAVVAGLTERLQLTSDDVSLGIAPVDHTLGLLTSITTPLAAGGQVLLAAGRRPSEVAALCARAAPTWCSAAPSTMRLLTATKSGTARMRFLRTSGAALPPSLSDQLDARFHAPVIAAYALTEAPGEVASQSLHELPTPDCVGRPTLCRVQIRPADPDLNLPIGAGQVWVAGPTVVTDAADGWLSTGDLGLLNADGQLQLLGRVDDLINLGGQKVSPLWLEDTVRQHPAISECVAFAIPQPGTADSQVGLAVVATTELTASTLRRFLSERLPRTSLPHQIRIVSALPRTSRGKVLRSDLAQALGLTAQPHRDRKVTGTDS